MKKHDFEKPYMIPFVILQVILFVAALISILKKPVTPKDKLPWLLVSLVNIIGPIIYFIIGSRKLDKKAGFNLETEL